MHPGHHHDGDHDHGMPHDFKGAEEWAKVFDDPSRDQWQHPDEVAGLLELTPGMIVADVGAGTGYFIGRLAQRVGPSGSVIATDLEPDMIRYLGDRGRRDGWTNVRPVQVAADDPGLAKASVDRVLVVDVWHHLDDRRAYAAKLAAALRPGGLIAVVDFELTASHGPPPKHRLAPAAIADDLRSAGLTVELAKEDLPEQYVVLARAPR
jgi:ubiquinone/menaquinone biosynthesis C-methylase UbiE